LNFRSLKVLFSASLANKPQIGETEGVKFLVLEKDGVPEKVPLRFMPEF